MFYAERIKYYFKSRQKDYTFRLFIRFLSILFVGLYIEVLYRASFDWYAYSLKYFITAFIVFLIYGILCNFGLFFITTSMAKKYRFFSTFLYLPTFFITPFVVGTYLYYLWLVLIPFGATIMIYCYFNPWKKSY